MATNPHLGREPAVGGVESSGHVWELQIQTVIIQTELGGVALSLRTIKITSAV